MKQMDLPLIVSLEFNDENSQEFSITKQQELKHYDHDNKVLIKEPLPENEVMYTNDNGVSIIIDKNTRTVLSPLHVNFFGKRVNIIK